MLDYSDWSAFNQHIAKVQLEDALLDGLTDYTSDERGDVGSWVRISCVKGLTSFSQTLFSRASSLPDLAGYLPPEKFDDAIAGVLKQGVERLDNVRQIAGESFLTLLESRRWFRVFRT